MKIHLLVLLVAASQVSHAQAELEYNFEADAEGWISVLESTEPVTAFARQPPSDLLRLYSYGISVSDGNSPHRDNEHNSGLLFRSPEFRFESIEDARIVFDLGSGTEDNSGAPSTDDDLVLTSPSMETGYVGLLLRNVDSGAYLLSSQLSAAPGGAAETITWTDTDLDGLINTQDSYTLDLVDLKHGPWGWISLDNVSIAHARETADFIFNDGFESGGAVDDMAP